MAEETGAPAGTTPTAAAAADGDEAASEFAGVFCGTGFTIALASAAAPCAAALAGSGAVVFEVAALFSSSRRTAELGAPRCA